MSKVADVKTWGSTMAGTWLMQPEKQTTTRWFPVVRTGAFEVMDFT